MSSATLFDRTIQYVRESSYLHNTIHLLHWDERTQMPAAGGEFRAEQLAFLSALAHQRDTRADFGGWLNELAAESASDPHGDRATTIRHLKRNYDKLVKLPTSLVEELTRATSRAHQAWITARQRNDFASFAPHLAHVIELKRQQAEAVGYAQQPYDALLDDYEPAATTEQVAGVLSALRAELVPLVAAIAASPRRPDQELLKRRYPVAAQQAFGTAAAAAIGFEFDRGRLDVTHHPFCTSLGPNDCRITTRYDERFFPSAFFGILHEAGHGIYDQGLRREWYGLPPGTFVSLGIHESQSRLWENMVGRGEPFWQYFFPQAQAAFPEALPDVAPDAFLFAVNAVAPSLIRVEADEVTYNLHIIIRFELEQAIFRNEIAVADLPAAWNDKYHQYLGIRPPSDADGILQDVHWSEGLFGYFPTYSLGNLYAAQFFAAAEAQIGPLPPQFARGEFRPLREWLRENIHQRGQAYTATELVEVVTARPLSHAPLISYLREKYGRWYQL